MALVLAAVVAGAGVVLLASSGDRDEGERVAPAPQNLPRRTAVHGASCARFGGLTDRSILQRPENVQVGSLTFVSLSEYAEVPANAFEPRRGSRYLAQKVLVLVRGDRDVTVVVPRSERVHASLLWGRTPGISRKEELRGLAQIGDGNPAVRFKGCAGKFMEYVGGGFVVAGARCLPLDVWVEGEAEPLRVVAPFGMAC